MRPCNSRNNARKSSTMASNTPALSQRWLCWYTVCQGGKSCGIIRQEAPARTIQRRPLKTSRKLWSRCGASSVMGVFLELGPFSTCPWSEGLIENRPTDMRRYLISRSGLPTHAQDLSPAFAGMQLMRMSFECTCAIIILLHLVQHRLPCGSIGDCKYLQIL